MHKESTTIIALVILAGIIGFIVVSFQRPTSNFVVAEQQKYASTTAYQDTMSAEKQNDVIITPKTIVTAKHAYQKGTHIFAGEVPMPTPCHLLEQGIRVSKDKSKISISLTASNINDEGCAQEITPGRFKLSVNANKNASIITTLNGQEITLNLIEVGPDDNLENFELYIKG